MLPLLTVALEFLRNHDGLGYDHPDEPVSLRLFLENGFKGVSSRFHTAITRLRYSIYHRIISCFQGMRTKAGPRASADRPQFGGVVFIVL